MNNTIQSNIQTRSSMLVNSAILAGTTTAGTLGAIAKNRYDKFDVDRGLKGEFLKYKENIAENARKISDTAKLAAENKKLKDDFNNMCNYFYNYVLKKTSKRNMLIGVFGGIIAGVAVIFAKNMYGKNKYKENK